MVLRRPLIGETLLCENEDQLQLAFVEKERPVKGYEYAVLVTDLSHELHVIAQLYRDRGAMRRTPSMRSRTNGAGPDSRPTI